MTSDNSQATIKSVATLISRGVTPAYTEEGGILVINQKCIRNGVVDLSAARRTDTEKKKVSSEKILQKFDVVVNSTGVGTLGRVAQIWNLSETITADSHVTIVRPNSSLVYPMFFGYVLKSLQPTIEAMGEGSTGQTELSRDKLGSIPIQLPNLSNQHEAAHLLKGIDDRITLLRETNKTLEAIAQAIFKSWFIDFDPVRAKMEGRAPSGLYEETAALFPDELVESDLGLVPKGWEVIPFRSVIEVIGGGTPKTSVDEYWGGDIPWFSVVDAPNQSDVFVIDTEKKITAAGLNGSSTKLLPVGTTIISARGTVGKIALTGCEMAMNQSCYGLRGSAKDRYFTYFSTARLVNQLKKNAHGSVFDTITQETFSGVRLAYPSPAVINAYENFVDPMMMKIRSNLYQVNTLAEIRDGLLPRLISGKLRLSGSLENIA